jgi:hypothetical protein
VADHQLGLMRIDELDLSKFRSRSDGERKETLEPIEQVKPEKFKFYTFPKGVLKDVCTESGASAVLILMILLETHFRRFGENPVKLTNQSLKPFGISRFAKYRALALLQKTGHIGIEKRKKKSPLISLKWLPIRKGQHVR